jgi:acetylornithine deacetylase
VVGLEFCDLGGDGLSNLGASVADVGVPKARGAVNVTVAVLVPDEHTVAVDEHELPALDGGHVRKRMPPSRHAARLTICIVRAGVAKMQLKVTDDLERRVCEHIASREAELVDLLAALIGFDTTTRASRTPARKEAALQTYLGDRLHAAGAAVVISEPDPGLVAGHPMIPEGFTFAGRPQLVARFPGIGGGRTLLLNGHVDVVDVQPIGGWAHEPFAGVVADGAVHGRGACDMKGGVACMVFAAEVLAGLGVSLAGDLLVNTVTEEESTGAGGLVSARTLTADAAIVPEPTGLDVWVACRGSLLVRISVQGRAGHAGLAPRHPDDDGAVNAIEKMAIVLEGIRRLREHWSLAPRHRYLSSPDCVPTIVQGGEWIVSHPSSCQLDCHIEYLPAQADEHGRGSLVESEFADWIKRTAAADPWLAAHPPRIEWQLGGVPPAEVATDEPIVAAALSAARSIGRPARLGGMDNWHDGATLTVEAGIPAICLGPGDIHLAHTTSESVPIADLVACAQALAVAALRYCGPASSDSHRCR